MLYMIDTDIVSYLVRSKSHAVERKFISTAPTQMAISAVTRAELLFGLKRFVPNHPVSSSVYKFLRMIQVFAWHPEAADHYAEIRHYLTSTGQPIGELDMMIAAHALTLGATLVTNNIRHYQRIPGGLLLENWAV